jgi:hypothetical protein
MITIIFIILTPIWIVISSRNEYVKDVLIHGWYVKRFASVEVRRMVPLPSQNLELSLRRSDLLFQSFEFPLRKRNLDKINNSTFSRSPVVAAMFISR